MAEPPRLQNEPQERLQQRQGDHNQLGIAVAQSLSWWVVPTAALAEAISGRLLKQVTRSQVQGCGEGVHVSYHERILGALA